MLLYRQAVEHHPALAAHAWTWLQGYFYVKAGEGRCVQDGGCWTSSTVAFVWFVPVSLNSVGVFCRHLWRQEKTLAAEICCKCPSVPTFLSPKWHFSALELSYELWKIALFLLCAVEEYREHIKIPHKPPRSRLLLLPQQPAALRLRQKQPSMQPSWGFWKEKMERSSRKFKIPKAGNC